MPDLRHPLHAVEYRHDDVFADFEHVVLVQILHFGIGFFNDHPHDRVRIVGGDGFKRGLVGQDRQILDLLQFVVDVDGGNFFVRSPLELQHDTA